MSHTNTALFVHLVWATWDRAPLITPTLEPRLHRCIQAEARGFGCGVLALNGMPDHVHLLVQLAPAVSVAALAKQVKGSASRLANKIIEPQALFRWQGGYAAFTIGRHDIPRLVDYINRQKPHHLAGNTVAAWEPPTAPPG